MDFLKNSSSNSKNRTASKDVDTEINTNNTSNTQIKKKKLETYKDPTTGVTLKRLKFTLWIEEHIPLFKKILVVFLIFAVIGLWMYAIIGFGWYIFKGMEQDEKMINELTRSNLISHEELMRKTTNKLNIGTVEVISQGSSYDLAVRIQNVNKQYRATYNYCFQQGEKKIDCGQSFILPQETKYVLSLANELNNASNINFQIKDRNWKLVNPREIDNWKPFMEKRLDFVFSKTNFVNAGRNERSGVEKLNTLSFKVKNNTSYGYWGVPLNIFLYDTSNIVGVNRYIINEFDSREEKDIELVWSGRMVGRITDIKIKPDLNIMDKSIYMKPQAAQEVNRFLPEQ